MRKTGWVTHAVALRLQLIWQLILGLEVLGYQLPFLRNSKVLTGQSVVGMVERSDLSTPKG